MPAALAGQVSKDLVARELAPVQSTSGSAGV
jgi:hypothetical protein